MKRKFEVQQEIELLRREHAMTQLQFNAVKGTLNALSELILLKVKRVYQTSKNQALLPPSYYHCFQRPTLFANALNRHLLPPIQHNVHL